MLTTLVLTAGLGTRLDPLTRIVAKGAVPVAGATLVERVLMGLARQGVRDVILNLHHRPETIAAAVGDGAHLGLRARYVWEVPLLGSAGGPRNMMQLVPDDELLIVNGDTISDLPIGEMIAAHQESGADVTMAVMLNPAPHHYNGIIADASHVVTRFIPKGHTEASWHFVGIQIVKRRVFETLEPDTAAETVAGIYRAIVAGAPGRVRVWPTTARFLDVGTARDYLETVRGFAHDAFDRGVVEAGASVAASAQLKESVVWAGARIGDEVSLTRCVVAGAVVVPAGTVASDRVIVPASLLTATDVLNGVDRRDRAALFPIV